MVTRDDKNVKCKYCNTVDRVCYPVFCAIENKPFGSEMCFGRGVCDTDPIPKYEFKKSCKIEDNKSVVTATINIKDVALDRYSKDGQEPLGPEQQDLKKENKIDEQFWKDFSIDISDFKFGTLQDDSSNQDHRKKHPFKESEQKHREKLVNHSNRKSSEGSRRHSSRLHSSMEHNHFFKISRTTNKELLKRKLKGKEINLAGPFTEPLNPGEQMKLGNPYNVHCHVGKDFYKDF